jgi:hypothetical protein
MDDQQGNVIDGTARARQWRLARSKTPAVTDDAEARSDAPKSIAGSLLVPADMLPAISPGGEYSNGDEESRATARPPPPRAATVVESASDEDALHQNPFLVPEAARAMSPGQGARPTSRGSTAAVIIGVTRAVTGWRWPVRFGQAVLAGTLGSRVRESRPTRAVVLALVSSAALALAAALLIHAEAASPRSTPAPIAGTTASSIDQVKSLALTAAANRFAVEHAAHRTPAKHVSRVRARRTNVKHLRNRSASSTGASSAATVGVRYTAPPTTDGSSAAATVPPTTVPATSQSSASSEPSRSSGQASNSANQPAFGANGALGPGSSPDS